MKEERKILLDISNLLDDFKITHCLMFGTLLGIYRDGKLIEKDDIDLGIFYQFWKNDELWRRFIFTLQEKGYRVRDMAYNYIAIDDYTDTHVDIYLLLRKETEYQVIVTGRIAHFPFEDFDTLDSITFLDKMFKIPHDVENHLIHNYGNWKIPNKEENWNSRTKVDNYEKITYTYIVSKYKTGNKICI